MKITANVYFYQGLHGRSRRGWSNSVLIKGEKIRILIDSGSNIKNHLQELAGSLTEDGVEILEIDEFWYTHGHPDHAGSAGTLSKQSKKKVRCHYLAEQIFKSPAVMKEFLRYFYKKEMWRKQILKTTSLRDRTILRLYFFRPFSWLIFKIAIFILEKIWGEWLPVFQLEVFDEEELIEINPNVKILFLPGHTPEEVGFWIESQKILIIGDLINVTSLWRQTLPILNNPNSNFGQTLFSLEKIAKLPIEILMPGHGLFLQGKGLINDLLRGMIETMNYHRQRVKEELAKNPKINIDELSKIVFKGFLGTAPDQDKKDYLVAILDGLGYYEEE